MTVHPAALNPITVDAMWAVAIASVLCASFTSITEAWREASAAHPRKTLAFALSFIAREQLAYARQIPMLLGMLLVTCVIVVILPFT